MNEFSCFIRIYNCHFMGLASFRKNMALLDRLKMLYDWLCDMLVMLHIRSFWFLRNIQKISPAMQFGTATVALCFLLMVHFPHSIDCYSIINNMIISLKKVRYEMVPTTRIEWSKKTPCHDRQCVIPCCECFARKANYFDSFPEEATNVCFSNATWSFCCSSICIICVNFSVFVF